MTYMRQPSAEERAAIKDLKGSENLDALIQDAVLTGVEVESERICKLLDALADAIVDGGVALLADREVLENMIYSVLFDGGE